MQDIDEIVHTIDRLQAELDDLAIRGLRTAGTSHLSGLAMLRQEFERIGAGHLAERIAAVVQAIQNDERSAAAALVRAQASLRVFERILSLEVAGALLDNLAGAVEEDDEDEDDP
ncbi:MAG: hypothetical protein AB7K24_02205 [Gemmataceae bacterium]